jgi:hypothetical protein
MTEMEMEAAEMEMEAAEAEMEAAAAAAEPAAEPQTDPAAAGREAALVARACCSRLRGLGATFSEGVFRVEGGAAEVRRA